VFADCDFDNAVNGITRSAFENCGQVCLGTERVYVERPIFDKFVAALKAKAEQMKSAAPLTPTPRSARWSASEHQQKVLGYYAKAVEEGATVVTGGGVPDMPAELKDGCWVQPTIWTGLPETAAWCARKSSAPAATCPLRHRRRGGAHGQRHRLRPGHLDLDPGHQPCHRVAEQIEVGLCWINSWFLRDLRTPFGGSKQSGIGREGGVHSLEFYTELRNVMIKY
jgi:aminomuconate-semialdehyde/2-hydroxymuconate-6-semialdehyde dehydrogenase